MCDCTNTLHTKCNTLNTCLVKYLYKSLKLRAKALIQCVKALNLSVYVKPLNLRAIVLILRAKPLNQLQSATKAVNILFLLVGLKTPLMIRQQFIFVPFLFCYWSVTIPFRFHSGHTTASTYSPCAIDYAYGTTAYCNSTTVKPQSISKHPKFAKMQSHIPTLSIITTLIHQNTQSHYDTHMHTVVTMIWGKKMQADSYPLSQLSAQ